MSVADANVSSYSFVRAASSLQPPTATGTINVNSQSGEVDVSLQGFTPSGQLQLLFAGLTTITLGPVDVDMSGNGGASFTLPPGQYSGSFQLIGLSGVQMITSQANFMIGSGSGGSSTSTTSASTVSSSSDDHERREPGGLAKGWAKSNVTVESSSFEQTIELNGVPVVITSVVVVYSTNGQIVTNFASNDNTAQVEFDHNGAAEVVVHSSARPNAVYADDHLLVEASTTAGLTANSNAWVYDKNSATLTVFADPSTVTMFYGSTPMPEYPSQLLPIATILATIAALAAVVAVRRTKNVKLKN